MTIEKTMIIMIPIFIFTIVNLGAIQINSNEKSTDNSLPVVYSDSKYSLYVLLLDNGVTLDCWGYTGRCSGSDGNTYYVVDISGWKKLPLEDLDEELQLDDFEVGKDLTDGTELTWCVSFNEDGTCSAQQILGDMNKK